MGRRLLSAGMPSLVKHRFDHGSCGRCASKARCGPSGLLQHICQFLATRLSGTRHRPTRTPAQGSEHPRPSPASIVISKPPVAVQLPQPDVSANRGASHPDPPRGLVAIVVQLAMVQATDGNGGLVADLAAERTRLSEANVVRFARRPTAYDAGLGREISAVFLVAKPDRFCGDATVAVANRLLRQNDLGRRRSIHHFHESLPVRRLDIIILRV